MLYCMMDADKVCEQAVVLRHRQSDSDRSEDQNHRNRLHRNPSLTMESTMNDWVLVNLIRSKTKCSIIGRKIIQNCFHFIIRLVNGKKLTWNWWKLTLNMHQRSLSWLFLRPVEWCRYRGFQPRECIRWNLDWNVHQWISWNSTAPQAPARWICRPE